MVIVGVEGVSVENMDGAGIFAVVGEIIMVDLELVSWRLGVMDAGSIFIEVVI